MIPTTSGGITSNKAARLEVDGEAMATKLALLLKPSLSINRKSAVTLKLLDVESNTDDVGVVISCTPLPLETTI